MSHPLFDKHKQTLEAAVVAIRERGYWSAYPEMPSGRIYGESAKDDGLAAFQNRLEFTINTLAIQEENAAAAESAIRDVDMAAATIEFTRNKILVEAGTSVLVQANLVPQRALILRS